MSRRPLQLGVADLLRRPGHRRSVELAAPVADLGLSTSRVPPGAEVELSLVLEAVGGAIAATGELRAPWTGECRRCLRAVDGEVAARVDELFERTPVEGDTYPLEGDHLDLAPVVRDQLLLELPLAPLCAADCRGLCPACGADRNAVDCGCEPDVGDPRWAALDELRFDR